MDLTGYGAWVGEIFPRAKIRQSNNQESVPCSENSTSPKKSFVFR